MRLYLLLWMIPTKRSPDVTERGRIIFPRYRGRSTRQFQIYVAGLE